MKTPERPLRGLSLYQAVTDAMTSGTTKKRASAWRPSSCVVEILGCYSNRARWTIDKFDVIRDAMDRIDTAELRRPRTQKPRPTQRYRLTDRFTLDELNQLVARYKAGETSTALARESGIAKSTFLRLLAEHGVGTRPRGLTPAKEGEILRLRKQGMIIREIAKRVGCSYDVVRIFLLAQHSD